MRVPKFLLSFLIVCLGGLAFFSYVRAPVLPLTGYPNLDHFRISQIPVYMNDFGQLAWYRSADLTLPPSPHDRIIFFGDSITERWPLKNYFPGKPYVNRGISAQTTSQMLVRFRQDVIDTQPIAVIISGGLNDIYGATGPIRLEDIESNYASMAELAQAHHIRVILCSVLPVNNYSGRRDDLFARQPLQKIRQLNQWLRNYCAAHGFVYINYHDDMLDASGALRGDLSQDGIHPNAAGYALMTPLAEAALTKLQSN